MTRSLIRLGYAVGTGEPVDIPLGHTAVTGQTQESGKTTTLEALAKRAERKALAFVTKRGEGAMHGSHSVRPYFRDRADWQFVTSIIDATLQEKNKFLRSWIMKICRDTKTLADVQRKIRKELETARGVNEGVYTQLDAYLDLIVPEIKRADLAKDLTLSHNGISVMDISGSILPMQMLFVQSALDQINDGADETTVVIPEAWEFIPEGKGSPVKSSAIALARKGAALGNYIWIDSQDMAGVDKTVLRSCKVWLIGVQREANEIKRNLANIPAGISKPTAHAVATLERGQFYACWGTHAVRTYVQPAWMSGDEAREIARGGVMRTKAPKAKTTTPIEAQVNESEARALRYENEQLTNRVLQLQEGLDLAREQIRALSSNAKVAVDAPRLGRRDSGDAGSTPASVPSHSNGASAAMSLGNEELYQAIKSRLIEELPKDPRVLRIVTQKPELRVEVQRQIISCDGSSIRGRIARMIAAGFFEQAKTSADVLGQLERTGVKPSNIELGNELKALVELGFFTRDNKWYKLVADMAVNVIEG